jgi:hypothetical protein
MTEIILKIRDLVGDGLITNGNDTFEYISSKVFTLTSPNADVDTIKVYKNGTLVASSNYTYDSNTAMLSYTGTIVVGNIIQITYSYYTKYSDNELASYLRNALYYLGVVQYKTFTIESGDLLSPTPSVNEESLIAIVASILMKGNIRSYRTPEISITFGDESGGSLSIDQKIRQLVSQFQKAYGVLEYIDPKENLFEDED